MRKRLSIILILLSMVLCMQVPASEQISGDWRSVGSLPAVYVAGDLAQGVVSHQYVLVPKQSPGVFRTTVHFVPGDDGLSHWTVFTDENLRYPYGAAGSADRTTPNERGILVKGSHYSLAAVPGTYFMTLDLNRGIFSLEPIGGKAEDFDVQPRSAVLVPVQAVPIKLFSIGNSLINVYQQFDIFNDIAQSRNTYAEWTPRSIDGYTLNDHWQNVGPGSARHLLSTKRWTHVIVQEFTTYPRTNPKEYSEIVGKWVKYIRSYNPDAVIILPMNWALLVDDLADYLDHGDLLRENTLAVARRYGLSVCPVGDAYQRIFIEDGADGLKKLFSDFRHPSLAGTYLAAVMEYSVITGCNPEAITHKPERLSEADAARVRRRAAETLRDFVNPVDHVASRVNFNVTGPYSVGFAQEGMEPEMYVNGDKVEDFSFQAPRTESSYKLTTRYGAREVQSDVRVAIPERTVNPMIFQTATDTITQDFDKMKSWALLPEPWRINALTESDKIRSVGSYDEAGTEVDNVGGLELPLYGVGGTFNFGLAGDSNRALGGLCSGVYGMPRSVNIYTRVVNNTGKAIDMIGLAYDVEKFRKGTNRSGFAVKLYTSPDGREWTEAGETFTTRIPKDDTHTRPEDLPEVIAVRGEIPVEIEAGKELFLAWNISVEDGMLTSSAPAIGVDNMRIWCRNQSPAVSVR